jgi:hypothetical protein
MVTKCDTIILGDQLRQYGTAVLFCPGLLFHTDAAGHPRRFILLQTVNSLFNI